MQRQKSSIGKQRFSLSVICSMTSATVFLYFGAGASDGITLSRPLASATRIGAEFSCTLALARTQRGAAARRGRPPQGEYGHSCRRTRFSCTLALARATAERFPALWRRRRESGPNFPVLWRWRRRSAARRRAVGVFQRKNAVTHVVGHGWGSSQNPSW